MARVGATPRGGSGCGGGGMSVAAARGIAERVHACQVDERGEPYINHVARVAAGVPLFARSVGWLHDVVKRSRVDESVLMAAGASLDECAALVFPRFEGHLSAFGESRRKLTKEVRSAEDKTAFPA